MAKGNELLTITKISTAHNESAYHFQPTHHYVSGTSRSIEALVRLVQRTMSDAGIVEYEWSFTPRKSGVRSTCYGLVRYMPLSEAEQDEFWKHMCENFHPVR